MKLVKPSEVDLKNWIPVSKEELNLYYHAKNYYLRILDNKSKNLCCVVSLPSDKERRLTCRLLRLSFGNDVSIQVTYASEFSSEEKDNAFRCRHDYEVTMIVRKAFRYDVLIPTTEDTDIPTTDSIETIVGNINNLLTRNET